MDNNLEWFAFDYFVFFQTHVDKLPYMSTTPPANNFLANCCFPVEPIPRPFPPMPRITILYLHAKIKALIEAHNALPLAIKDKSAA
jgi:hypothetical protein